MINKIENIDLNCNIFSVYDYDEMTMQELLCQFFTKINECIEVSNKSLSFLDWLISIGLKEEVVKLLMQWYNDGTLANIINETIFNDLNNKINSNFTTLDNKINEKFTTLDNEINKLKIPQLTFLEPEQGKAGDCSVIKLSEGNFIMIDCGEEGSFNYLVSQLDALKCDKLEKLFITHSHSDHIGNAVQIIEKYKPKQLYCRTVYWDALPEVEVSWRTKILHEAMLNKAIEIGCEVIEATDTIIKLTNEEDLKIMGTGYNNYSDYNHMSICFQYNYRNLAKCLFAGDITNETENYLIGLYGLSMESDVIKLAHHGTNSSNHLNFLYHVRPRVCVGSSYVLSETAGGIEVTKRCYWLGARVYDVWSENRGGTLAIIGKHFIHGLNEVDLSDKWFLNKGKYGYIKTRGSLARSEIIHYQGEFYYIGDDWYMMSNCFIPIDGGNIYYYSGDNGVLYRNQWLEHNDGYWYYFHQNFKMLKNTSIKLNGVVYIFDEEGHCLNPND